MVAAQLVTNAILEIRSCAARGSEHLDRIQQLADIVQNLPDGMLGGGERRTDPSGYRTFRRMWETASAEERAWLTSQFELLHYDYSYLDIPPRQPPGSPSAGHDRPRR
jgi:hypothetical protein